MPIPDYKGRSAEEIIATPYYESSGWHIHIALCWCDYAERKRASMALHYAALHLRTGVEQLWFEVLFASRGGSLSFSDYEKCVNTTTKLYKLIDSEAPHYAKFAEFIKIIGAVDSKPMPPTVIWDIPRLKRIHGECGHRLLHFAGILERGYLSENWFNDQSKYLFDAAYWIGSTMASTGNLAVFNLDGLKPEVISIWERFRDGLIEADDARYSLNLILPMLGKK